MNQCAGIVVEVDTVKNSAVILTSAWIICSKKPLDDWKNKEYDPEAKAKSLNKPCTLFIFPSSHSNISDFKIIEFYLFIRSY
jgi:hypothetical protein